MRKGKYLFFHFAYHQKNRFKNSFSILNTKIGAPAKYWQEVVVFICPRIFLLNSWNYSLYKFHLWLIIHCYDFIDFNLYLHCCYYYCHYYLWQQRDYYYFLHGRTKNPRNLLASMWNNLCKTWFPLIGSSYVLYFWDFRTQFPKFLLSHLKNFSPHLGISANLFVDCEKCPTRKFIVFLLNWKLFVIWIDSYCCCYYFHITIIKHYFLL